MQRTERKIKCEVCGEEKSARGYPNHLAAHARKKMEPQRVRPEGDWRNGYRAGWEDRGKAA